MPDFDYATVLADAAADPTLDRDCEEGADCTDANCPLVHPEVEDNDALGPCGCTDYHMADCDLMTGGSAYDDGFRDEDDDYYDYEG